MRSYGRGDQDLRPVDITPGFIKSADGSALIAMGETRVICTAKLEDRVPPFLRKSGKGLDHRGVRHAAVVVADAHPQGGGSRQGRRAHP